MGIFSDKCQALIDPETGKCLSGEALRKAEAEPQGTRCGRRVKKAARRCSACGAPAPGGWAKCGGCGKWVGAESEFCWNCGHELHPEDRAALADGRWRKQDGMLAKRVDVGDIKAILQKGSIIIESGSAALLFQNGRFKALLKAGEHTLDSVGRKINHWGNPPPRSVVLMDTGDIIVPIRVEDLRTSEDIPVQLYAEAIVRLVPDSKAAQAYAENVLKDVREMQFPAFAEMLTSEIRYAMRNLCNTSTIEDLFKDPLLRIQIEDALQQTLTESQARYGFTLARVSCAEFTGKAYEQLRQQNGDMELTRRRLEFDQQLRDTMNKDKMQAFASTQELDEYVAQLSHEKEITDAHRDQELALLKQVHRGELDAQAASLAMAAEMKSVAHAVGIRLKQDDYAREKAQDDAKSEAEVARIWMDIRKEKEELKRQDQAEEIKLYEGKDLKTLIAALPEEKHAALLNLNEQLMTEGMTQEQILAVAAKNNPDLAHILLEQTRMENKDRDKDWEERKELLEAQAERLERVMTKALDATADAAKGQGSSTQVIK